MPTTNTRVLVVERKCSLTDQPVLIPEASFESVTTLRRDLKKGSREDVTSAWAQRSLSYFSDVPAPKGRQASSVLKLRSGNAHGGLALVGLCE